MPDGNPLASLYPQPPAQPQNALTGDPLKTISGVLGIQSQQLQQEQTKAAIQSIGIANTTAQFQQRQAQLQAVRDQIGSIADKPGLSMEDINDHALKTARAMGIPGEIINTVRDTLPRDPAGLKQAAQTMRNLSIGSAGVAGRDTGPPDASGAPSTIPRGAANYAGAVTTGLPPGVAETAAASGSATGAQLGKDLIGAGNYRREVFPLEKAIPALEALGKSGTGPGTEEFNNVKSFLQSAGVPGLDVNKIKDFDEAKKYLTDWVTANGDIGTNDKLAATFASNASTKISNAAAVDVAKSALALRRMKQAQVSEFAKTGLPDSAYAKWALQFNSNQDPTAYGYDMMTPQAQQRLVKSLKPGSPAYQRFTASLSVAHQNGLINAPDKANAGQ